MTDFETHSIGTAKELRLSRELTAEIKQAGEQYGFGLFPQNVMLVYNKLVAHYKEQIENERYNNGI